MNRTAMLAALLLLTACEPSSTPAPKATPSATAPVAEKKSETAEPPPADDGPAGTKAECTPFRDRSELDAWMVGVRKDLDAKKYPLARKAIACIDPQFDITLLSDVDSQKLEAFSGQLDADADEEWVVQLRQHGPLEGAGERRELYWIGVFDKTGDAYHPVGNFKRPRLDFCNQATDKIGVKFGFTQKKPGPEAALWVIEQVYEACGTLVDIKYRKHLLKVSGDALDTKELTPPEGMTYDRMEGLR